MHTTYLLRVLHFLWALSAYQHNKSVIINLCMCELESNCLSACFENYIKLVPTLMYLEANYKCWGQTADVFVSQQVTHWAAFILVCASRKLENPSIHPSIHQAMTTFPAPKHHSRTPPGYSWGGGFRGVPTLAVICNPSGMFWVSSHCLKYLHRVACVS